MAKPIITRVLARTTHFLFDAVQLSLLPLVDHRGLRKVLMRDIAGRFFAYAEKKLNCYCLCAVYFSAETFG
jgi:hypothetical protein